MQRAIYIWARLNVISVNLLHLGFQGVRLARNQPMNHPGVRFQCQCRTTLESVFNALVQPYFNYCSEVWGYCNKSLSNKLQKLQNRAARIQTFSSYDTSADPLFEQLNWKRLDTQRQIQVATMVNKSIHGLAPDYLSSLFTKYDPPYNLRNSENKLAVPLPRTNFLKIALAIMVRLSGTACPLNCGKQNHFNLFEMVVAISSSESTKRTRHLCKAEFLFFLYFHYLQVNF